MDLTTIQISRAAEQSCRLHVPPQNPDHIQRQLNNDRVRQNTNQKKLLL